MIFVSRAEWGHHGPRGGRSMGGGVGYSVCHHTPDQEPTNYAQAIEELHQVLGGHLQQDWGDIGYTFVIWDKYCFEGRGWGRTGAHAPGANSISVGIAFLLDGRDRSPTQTEWNTAADIVREGVSKGWINPAFVTTGHRDWVATACPSELVYGNLINLRLTYEGSPPVQEEDDLQTDEREWLRHIYEMSKALPAINHNAHYTHLMVDDMLHVDPERHGPAEWYIRLLGGMNHVISAQYELLKKMAEQLSEVDVDVSQIEAEIEDLQVDHEAIKAALRENPPTEPVGQPVPTPPQP